MTMQIEAMPVPLRIDEGGVVRVGETRVTLDTVVYAYRDGATPEEIIDRYPSLSLATVYAALSYMLLYPAAVETYLSERERVAAAVRDANERRFPPAPARERLAARRAAENS